MAILDLASVPTKMGSDYPAPFGEPLAGRVVHRVSRGGGLTDFLANHVTIPPGGWSSQRHWHEGEDELVVVLSGEGVLVDDHGRHPVAAGSIMTFPKAVANGHRLQNEGATSLVLLAVSLEEKSTVHYPDIDLLWRPDVGETHLDGTPYPKVDPFD
jgi:uncharacterized cupin superfamily protein